MSARSALQQPSASRAGAAQPLGAPVRVAACAVAALHDEVALFPKPGLVSFVDSGSHQDMDGKTFMRSLFSLRHGYQQMAVLGAEGRPFAALEACGLAAEQRMYAATGGVNTHRGAIFSMGLLCASAGALWARDLRVSAEALRAVMLELWGDDLLARCVRRSGLPGGTAAQRYGLRSASEEAALGFPVLFEHAYPTLAAWLQRGASKEAACLQAFMQTMSILDDCNLAHRGGLEGLAHARHAAAAFMEAGGMAHPQAMQTLRLLHENFVFRRLSPGGSADMLAAACFIARLTGVGGPPP